MTLRTMATLAAPEFSVVDLADILRVRRLHDQLDPRARRHVHPLVVEQLHLRELEPGRGPQSHFDTAQDISPLNLDMKDTKRRLNDSTTRYDSTT